MAADIPASEEPRLRVRKAEVASRVLKDETIVLDLRSSTYLAMNPAGSVLWRQLEQGTTRSQLIAALVEAFGVSDERAVADVDAFLTDCRSRGLVAEEPSKTERG